MLHYRGMVQTAATLLLGSNTEVKMLDCHAQVAKNYVALAS